MTKSLDALIQELPNFKAGECLAHDQRQLLISGFVWSALDDGNKFTENCASLFYGDTALTAEFKYTLIKKLAPQLHTIVAIDECM